MFLFTRTQCFVHDSTLQRDYINVDKIKSHCLNTGLGERCVEGGGSCYYGQSPLVINDLRVGG